MSKKEKIEAIKELAASKRRKLLTDKEIKLLKEKGYNLPIFLQSNGTITMHSNETQENKEIITGIARKLDRRIIQFTD